MILELEDFLVHLINSDVDTIRELSVEKKS